MFKSNKNKVFLWHIFLDYLGLYGVVQYINFQFAHFDQSTLSQTFAGGLWMQFSPDGQRFVIGDTNAGLHIWEFEQMQPLITIQGEQGWMKAAAWSPDGKTLVLIAALGIYNCRLLHLAAA